MKMNWYLFNKFNDTYLNKNWQKLVEKRNLIAHGSDVNVSREEAKGSFETVVRGIFYILERTSTIQD
jgi:hypothetical protein